MSRSLYTFLEVQDMDKFWHLYGELPIKPSGSLFRLLSKTEEKPPFLLTTRGEPKNLSKVVKMHLDRDGNDAEDFSFYYFEELREIDSWARENYTYIPFYDIHRPGETEIKYSPPFGVYFFGLGIFSFILGKEIEAGGEVFEEKKRSYDLCDDIYDMRMVYWFT